jgi:hypothetical protein
MALAPDLSLCTPLSATVVLQDKIMKTFWTPCIRKNRLAGLFEENAFFQTIENRGNLINDLVLSVPMEPNVRRNQMNELSPSVSGNVLATISA